MSIPSVLNAAHMLVGRGLTTGDLAIDATVGNGHDTLFLTQAVGAEGRVVGFDIQREALDATRKRVHAEAPHAAEGLRLIRDGHETLAEHLDEEDRGQVGAITFNLGYLPGGDHSITTEPASTLVALRSAVKLLRSGGIITIVAYSGHDGGAAETTAVAEWLSSLSQEQFQVLSYHFMNQKNDPPRLFALEKCTGSE